ILSLDAHASHWVQIVIMDMLSIGISTIENIHASGKLLSKKLYKHRRRNTSMDSEKLCRQIFAFNDGVRYAGVIDSSGAQVAGGMRNGIDSIVNETDEELFLTQTALRKSMRERFDRSMGR